MQARQGDASTLGRKAATIISLLMFILVLVGGALIARRNYVRSKGDTRAAFRILVTVFVIKMATWLCWAHPTSAWATLSRLIAAISGALFVSGLVWALYVALEPYVRRHWPDSIISWSRLVSGRLRDPLVGRDLLSGVVLGVAWELIFGLQYLVLLRAGYPPQMGDPALLLGAWETVGRWLGSVLNIVAALSFFAVLFLLRAALRNTWRAIAVLVAILTAMTFLGSRGHPVIAITMAILWSTAAIALVRFGLIATIVGFMVTQALQSLPYTLDFSTWYASHVLGAILSFVTLAVWGFYTSAASGCGRASCSNDPLDVAQGSFCNLAVFQCQFVPISLREARQHGMTKDVEEPQGSNSQYRRNLVAPLVWLEVALAGQLPSRLRIHAGKPG